MRTSRPSLEDDPKSRTTFPTLRAVADAERATIARTAHLLEDSKRATFSRALSGYLLDCREELASVLDQRAARVAAVDAAKAEALHPWPQPSEALAMQIAATARQDTDFRAYLTPIVNAGASASSEDRTLVLALASAPHSALFGMGETDWRTNANG